MSLREKITHWLFMTMLMVYLVGMSYLLTRYLGLPILRWLLSVCK